MNVKPRFPGLKIKLPSGSFVGDVLELKQARDLLDFEHAVFMVDGQTVHSYEELSALVTREDNQEKEFVEVALLQVIEGG